MKQDILVYMLAPPIAFISTTITIAFLPLLKIIDISAELSELNGSPPVIDYVLLMLILYYVGVAVLIKDNEKMCLLKMEKLIRTTKLSKSEYGAETIKQLDKLQHSVEFKQYIKSITENKGKANEHEHEIVQSKRNKVIELFNESDDDSNNNDNMLLTCHQVATSKKMF